jgi:hypothetical protein
MSAGVFRRTSLRSTKQRTSTHAPEFASFSALPAHRLVASDSHSDVSHRIGPIETSRGGPARSHRWPGGAGMTAPGQRCVRLSAGERRVRSAEGERRVCLSAGERRVRSAEGERRVCLSGGHGEIVLIRRLPLGGLPLNGA